MPLGAKSTAEEVVQGCNLQGKVAVVTGGNSGIGVETVRAFAIAGAKVYLCCRDEPAGTAVAKEISRGAIQGEVVVKHLDLADLGSVKNFVADYLASGDELHYLVLNAGLEMVMGVNHVGHFVLTEGLLHRMKAQNSEARVVAVSSSAHGFGTSKFDATDLNWEKRKYDGMTAYGESKLANILFVKELAERCAGSNVSAFSVHPGAISSTGLQRHAPAWLRGTLTVLFFVLGQAKTVQQGAATSLWAAVEPSLTAHSGAYLEDCRVSKPAAHAENMDLAKKLWQATEDLVKLAMQKMST